MFLALHVVTAPLRSPADTRPRACSKVLEKFRIGTLEDAAPTVSYEQQGVKDSFYEELKGDVNKYFRDNKVRAAALGGPLLHCVCAVHPQS